MYYVHVCVLESVCVLYINASNVTVEMYHADCTNLVTVSFLAGTTLLSVVIYILVPKSSCRLTYGMGVP